MTKTARDFLENKTNEPTIDDYTWETEYELGTNNDNMNEWLEDHLPADYTLIEDSLDGTYAEIITEEGHKFACHASGNGDFRSHKIEFKLLEKAKEEQKLINERPPFSKDTIISRDDMGWNIPAGCTKEAGLMLKEAVDSYGHLMVVGEALNMKDFSARIKDYSTKLNEEKNREASVFSDNLKWVEHMTLVIFDGDHRNSTKTDYQYSVIGTDLDDAEKLIDQIWDNEIKKSKYQDNVERRGSVFLGAGGELKSVVFIKDNPKIKNKKTI